MLVRGSRLDHTVQPKMDYPKLGGGEDVDFVFQMKEYYKGSGKVVAVPAAVVTHP